MLCKRPFTHCGTSAGLISEISDWEEIAQKWGEILRVRAEDLVPSNSLWKRGFAGAGVVPALLTDAGAGRGPASCECQLESFYSEAISTQDCSPGCSWGSLRDTGQDTKDTATISTRRTTSCLSFCLHFSGPWGWMVRRKRSWYYWLNTQLDPYTWNLYGNKDKRTPRTILQIALPLGMWELAWWGLPGSQSCPRWI